jgi:hypothetical protein
MAVVVVRVLLEHDSGVPLVDDQEAVEKLAANGADHALAYRAEGVDRLWVPA